MIQLTLNLKRAMIGDFGYKYSGKSSRTVGGTPWPGVMCRPADPDLRPADGGGIG